MPVYPLTWTNPVYWNVWGHSYFNNAFGPRAVYGRIDGFFRALIPIGYGDFANYAVTGARLSVEGQSQGGYARILNNVVQIANSTGPSGPAVAQMGAHIFCYGINDLGFNTNTTQYNAAYARAMRAVISRARMSWLRPNNWAGAAGTGVYTYSGFTNTAVTGEYTTGLTGRFATVAASTVTFTLPSDYNGETIASLWIANPGVAGAPVMTITGTAVAGTPYSGATFSTSNIMPSASLNHSPVCHRIKNLTAAQAGQTIIYTITTLDASATVVFDSIWGEALNPQPVIWCNTPRLTATGYAIYPTPPTNAAVATFNAVQPPVAAEFDQMVQIADIDAAIGKDPVALIYDGLHPNEIGGALCAKAFQDALTAMSQPTSKYGIISNLQPPGPRYAQDVIPHMAGQWYTQQAAAPAVSAGYTPVAGDMWAIPFMLTSAARRIIQWMVQLSTTSTAGTTVWFGIFDDRAYSGYPQVKHVDTTATAVTLPVVAGVFTSSLTGGVAGNISQPMDPGLYWAVMSIGTVSTPSPMLTLRGPCKHMPALATATGAQLGTFAAPSFPAAWKLTGQANAVLPKTFPPGAALADNAPMIGLKLS